MNKVNTYAIIELGDDSIRGMLVRKDSDGCVKYVASHEVMCAGALRFGAIYSLGKVNEAIGEITKELNHYLDDNYEIKSYYIGYSGVSLHSRPLSLVQNINGDDGGEITEAHLNHFEQEFKSVAFKNYRMIGYESPHFLVDNQREEFPYGKFAYVFTAYCQSILVSPSTYRNIKSVVADRQKLKIQQILPAPAAEAKMVLGKRELVVGATVVHLRKESCSVVVYEQNAMRLLRVIPIGYDAVTRDIASIGMTYEEAEQTKIDRVSMPTEEHKKQTITLGERTLGNEQAFSLYEINMLAEARIREIVLNIMAQVNGYYNNNDKHSFVLLGDTPEMVFIKEMLEEMKHTARLGSVNEHMVDDNIICKDDTWLTCLSVALEAESDCTGVLYENLSDLTKQVPLQSEQNETATIEEPTQEPSRSQIEYKENLFDSGGTKEMLDDEEEDVFIDDIDERKASAPKSKRSHESKGKKKKNIWTSAKNLFAEMVQSNPYDEEND